MSYGSSSAGHPGRRGEPRGRAGRAPRARPPGVGVGRPRGRARGGPARGDAAARVGLRIAGAALLGGGPLPDTMTLTTVGYGQLGPLSPGTRWILCLALPVAVTAAGLLAGQLAERLREPWERLAPSRSRRARLLLPSSSVVLAVSLASGAAFSCWGSQGWTFLDGFYFGAVTVTTVGYGDLSPSETEVEMWLAAALMWTGVVLVSAWLQRIGLEASGLGSLLSRQLPRASGNALPLAAGGRGRGRCGRRCRRLLAERCAELAPESDAGREALAGLVFLAALHAGGAVLFSWLEAWSLADGAYFTAVTLSTVGYGDLCPSHAGSRAATAAFVLVGVPACAELVGSLSCFWAGALAEALEGAPAGSSPERHACLSGGTPEIRSALQGATESISVRDDDTAALRKPDGFTKLSCSAARVPQPGVTSLRSSGAGSPPLRSRQVTAA
ncbi:unnamed protein product [Prorocentrum cordatum]|uniref:Potassium channel domain-containing protein n=1 Tax=Prorocentrum cordatum TaxID=2364126 RepID=A0ABN9WIH8_9DINO|nr:unnamed protein product [Polarella glacialis]